MLINLRNAMMSGGKRLPYDAEVEYLESTGTQWIDTGIDPSYITYFKISFSTTNLDMSGNKCIVGGGAFNAYAWLLVFQNNSQLRFYGNGTRLASITQGEEATFEIEATQSTTNNMNFVVKKNGAQTYSGTLASQYTATGSLYLFSMNGGSYAANRLRIHYVDINNHKFIPIAIGTTGYMLDLVSGEYLPYGNAGTGDFVIGPDI